MSTSDIREGISFTRVIKGFVLAVCSSIFLILLGSLIFYFTSLSEKFIGIVSLSIIFFSVFLGAFIVSKESGNKGLLQGLLVGIFFLIFNLLLSLVFGTEGFVLSTMVSKTIVSLLSGAVGGIVGIGFSNE
ncbi:MAG: TIGR04086 family membrane protein [Bacillota bacterium]|nr:TIGR04086 family membrane protein [Bacillota bacterium]